MMQTICNASLLLLTLLLTSGLVTAAPQWVSLNGNAEATPTVAVLDHSNFQTTIQVTLPGFWVDQITEAGETYQILTLGGRGTTMEIGAPMLPMLHERIGIPARSDVRVRLSNLETVMLPNYRVYPFQTPTTDENVKLPFELNEVAYATNQTYPAEIATVSDPQIWRDIRLVELNMAPMRTNPVSRELEVAVSFTVTLEYQGMNPVHALDREPTAVNPHYANLYRMGLLNYNEMGLDETRLDEPGTKYLFVMKPEALPYVQPLIDFRHAQGYKTEVKFIENPNFNDDWEIKDYISTLYFTTGLEFVLLVGDAYYSGGPSAVDVPMHYWQDTYSDIWYVSLQGDQDYYADLSIGRIVYDNASELEHQISKTVDYLQTPDLTTNWAINSLLVAHQEQYPLKYTQCKEEIRTYPYALETPVFATAYGGAGATNTQVINLINNYGCGLLNYRGHGSATEWWQWGPSGSFTATHVYQLTNFDRYFVHFDVCCDNMNFPGYAGDCLAESFMKAPAAAIGINGAIEPSYTIPNHDYDKEFYKAVYDQGITRIGYASNYANVVVVNVHGGIGQSNYRTYLWLGDSAIDLWTNAPQPLNLEYASTVNLATDDFTVSVTSNDQPVENALVCAQSEFAYARGFTNSSGVAYLIFSEYPEATTTVTITATAHNCLLETGSCTVVPATAPYDFFVQLTPTGGTTLPPTGGTINYNGQIQNNEIYPINTQVWTDWIYPDGTTIHEPFINRSLTLNPANLVERDLYINVAGSEPAGTYTYRLCIGTYQGGAIYAMDTFEFTKSAVDGWAGGQSEWVSTTTFSDWDELNASLNDATLPQNYSLSQHPNPFNPETEIIFALPVDGKVRLTIYDLMGREVAVLVDGLRSAGIHEVTFNAVKLSSGIYISNLQVNGTQLTSKLVLLK